MVFLVAVITAISRRRSNKFKLVFDIHLLLVSFSVFLSINMLIFFGLGNNDTKYLQTKHNLGRLVVQNIASKLGGKFELSAKTSFYKHTFEIENRTQTAYFVYSNGFMNTSGEALASFLKYYKIDTKNPDLRLIIAHDDSDQIESTYKFLPGGGSAGHNGIIDIYKHLPSLNMDITKVWRLKIGIRPPENKLKSETFVLTKASLNDVALTENLGNKIYNKLDLLLTNQFDKFQSHLYL